MSRRADVETFQGSQEEIALSVWPNDEPRRIVILVHGNSESPTGWHSRRQEERPASG